MLEEIIEIADRNGWNIQKFTTIERGGDTYRTFVNLEDEGNPARQRKIAECGESLLGSCQKVKEALEKALC